MATPRRATSPVHRPAHLHPKPGPINRSMLNSVSPDHSPPNSAKIQYVDETMRPLAADILQQASDLAAKFSDPATDTQTKHRMINHLIDYSKQFSQIYPSLDLVSAMHQQEKAVPLFRALRLLTVDKDPTSRAQSLRALRYVLAPLPSPSLSIFYQLNCDLFMVRSLERESKFLWERLQAFKLFKRLFTIHPQSVTRAIIASIIAIAEQPKDDFRRVSLDSIREMMLSIPDAVCQCNGMKVLIDAILDPACQDIAGNLTLTLLFMLDQESTRRFLRPTVEIIRLFSVFTDTTAGDGPDREARRLAAHRCLVTMMRSWSGIIYLTSEPAALRSLIQVLTLPSSVKGSSWAREAVFDLILEVLQVVKSADLRSVHSRARLTSGMSNDESSSASGFNLLHPYIVAVLLALIECGLVETLTHLASGPEPEFRSVSTKLLIEILALASDLLPPSLTAQLNSIPSVVAQSLQFDHSDISNRVRALQLVTTLTSSDASMQPMQDPMNPISSSQTDDWQAPSWSHDSPLKPRFEVGSAHDLYSTASLLSARMTQHGIRLDRYMAVTSFNYQLHQSSSTSTSSLSSHSASTSSSGTRHSHAHDLMVDAQELDALIKRTQIPYTKDYRVWDLPLILQVLEGPLTNPTLLQTVMQKTKFIKRLCSFLRPEKQLFSGMDFIPPHLVFVQIAVSLFRTMLSCPEGREYMFFTQLCDNIFQLLLSEISRGSDTNASPNQSNSSIATTGPLPSSASMSSLRSRSHSHSQDDNDVNHSSVGGLVDAAKSISAQAQAHTRKLTRMVKGKTKSSYRCLSRINAPRKLSQSYFLLVGLLSSTRFGLSYFDKYGLYDHLYRLGTDHSKDYLTRMLMLHLDYSERTARTLLETWMKTGSVSLRKFAVSFLRGQMRLKRPGDYAWAIGMLAHQLMHPDPSLRGAVLSLLDEAIEDPVCRATLIKKKPPLAHCGMLAHPIILSFLSSPAGLDYLNTTPAQPNGSESMLHYWMNLWKTEGCVRYVENLEASLVEALSDEIESKTGESGNQSNNHSATPTGGKSAPSERIERGGSLQVDKGLAATTQQGPSLLGTAQSINQSINQTVNQTINQAIHPTPPATRSPSPSLPSVNQSPNHPSSQPNYHSDTPFFLPQPITRSAADDYFFTRLHDLPWTVEVACEWTGGRTVPIMCDAYIFSNPYECYSQSAGQSSNRSSRSQCYLVCPMLNSAGVAAPYKVDPSATLRARVSCGTQSYRSNPANPSANPSINPINSDTPEPRRAFEQALHNWHPNYFSFPQCEQIVRPSARSRAAFQSAKHPSSPPSQHSSQKGREVLWTSTKEEDRAQWTFLTELPADSSSHSTNNASSETWLESICFPLSLPGSEVPSVCLAKHFYGELARTSQGCDLLRDTGHVKEFVDAIKQSTSQVTHQQSFVEGTPPTSTRRSTVTSPKMSNKQSHLNATNNHPVNNQPVHQPSDLLTRSSLWCLGSIGTSAPGFNFLTEIGLPNLLGTFALCHPTLSFRGTCFYFVSLLCRSVVGRRALAVLGWYPGSSGVSVPHTSSFFSCPRTSEACTWPQHKANTYGIHGKDGVARWAPFEQDVLLAMPNLCNYVTQRPSLDLLRSMKAAPATSNMFTQAHLLLECFRVLTTYTFRLPARRFLLFDLFGNVHWNEQSIKVFDQVFDPTRELSRETSTSINQSTTQSMQILTLSPRMSAARKSDGSINQSAHHILNQTPPLLNQSIDPNRTHSSITRDRAASLPSQHETTNSSNQSINQSTQHHHTTNHLSSRAHTSQQSTQ